MASRVDSGRASRTFRIHDMSKTAQAFPIYEQVRYRSHSLVDLPTYTASFLLARERRCRSNAHCSRILVNGYLLAFDASSTERNVEEERSCLDGVYLPHFLDVLEYLEP